MIGNYDKTGDQIGGGDMVGSGTDYGLFMTFNDSGSSSNTDGTIGFRIRLGEAGATNPTPALKAAAWIGIDADLNGSVDVFIGVNFSGSSNTFAIYDAGTGANNSPSTTTVSGTPYNLGYAISPLNYNYRAVDSGSTKDGGNTNDAATGNSKPDYYVSFMLPFADVVGFLATQAININDQTPLRYISATSSSANNLNGDYGGMDGSPNPAATWESLGGFSQIVNSSGTVVVPETSTPLLALAGLAIVVSRRKRTAL